MWARGPLTPLSLFTDEKKEYGYALGDQGVFVHLRERGLLVHRESLCFARNVSASMNRMILYVFYHAAGAEDVEGIYKTVITYLHSLHRMWYSSSFGRFDGSRRTFTIVSEETGTRRTDQDFTGRRVHLAAAVSGPHQCERPSSDP